MPLLTHAGSERATETAPPQAAFRTWGSGHEKQESLEGGGFLKLGDGTLKSEVDQKALCNDIPTKWEKLPMVIWEPGI